METAWSNNMEIFTAIGIVVFLIVVAVSIDDDNFLPQTLSVLIAVAAAVFLLDLDLISLARSAVVWVPAYLVLGVAWVFVKWYLFLKRERRRQEERHEDYVERVNVRNEYAKSAAAKSNDLNKERVLEPIRPLELEPPRARDNKDKIISWLVWWPFYVVNSALKDALTTIYDLIAGSLDRISKRVFS
jgi:hypothetical protein